MRILNRTRQGVNLWPLIGSLAQVQVHVLVCEVAQPLAGSKPRVRSPGLVRARS